MPRNTGSQGGSGNQPRKKSWSGARGHAKPAAVGARKSLGQHFLRDQGIADAIVAAAALAPNDTVIEIGPGPGVLTGRIVQQAGRLVAIELDDRFAAQLLARYVDTPTVQVVHADVLDCDLPALAGGAPWKAVANIPYYITSPIIRHLLEARDLPALAVLMVQKEVAERICATPGDLSLLAVSVQLYAAPELLFAVPAAAFAPQPKVDSAVLRLVPHPTPLLPDVDRTAFFHIVRAGFSQKRKQLANSLSAALLQPKPAIGAWLHEAGIDPERRAETLALDEWGALARTKPVAW